MARVRVRVDGLREVERAFNRKLASVGRIAPQALVDVGLQLWGEANQTAPKDTGDLRASAYLKVNGQETGRGERPAGGARAPVGAEQVTVEFGYGVPYALYVHEMPPYKNPTTPGTRPKWLELALAEHAARFLAYIRRKSKEAVEE